MYDISNMKNSYISYNLDNRENLEKKVYEQLGIIIKESKNEIDRLSQLNNEYLTYEQILKIYEENNKNFHFKETQTSQKLDNNFISVIYKAPVGLIYVETEKDEDVFTEMLNCIKTRNAMLISLEEWNELDMKHFLLLLVRKALEIYNIDVNLIDMAPYEECDERLFDLKKYNFYKNEIEYKQYENLNYVYIENSDFEKVALQNKNAFFLRGTYEDVVKELNNYRYRTLSIYTHDLKLAYKMGIEVQINNLLVNTDVSYAIDIENSDSYYLRDKHVMFEYLNIV